MLFSNFLADVNLDCLIKICHISGLAPYFCIHTHTDIYIYIYIFPELPPDV